MIVKSSVCGHIPTRGLHRVDDSHRSSGYGLLRGGDGYEVMGTQQWSDHRLAYDEGPEVRGSQHASWWTYRRRSSPRMAYASLTA